MSDFENFALNRWTVAPTPDAAGLPSDAEVTRQLRAAVITADPESFWPEHRHGINGDGNFDRGDVYAPASFYTMRAAGSAAARKMLG